MPIPHRYWRVMFTDSSGGVGNNIWLDEVTFRDGAGTDLSVGGTPISNSERPGGAYPPSQAFDKTTSTDGWSSIAGALPSWIGYVHPTAVDVAYVDITCSDSGSADPYLPAPYCIFVEWSDDGTVWNRRITWLEGTIAVASTFKAWVPEASAAYTRSTSVRRMPGTSLYAQNQLNIRRVGQRIPFFFHKDNVGNGTISGTVTIENIPGSRKVRLFRKQDGMLIRETWSAANGAYIFERIDPNWEYFVVAHDHLRVYNGVIQDMLVP